ncbi:ABC transporter ATP-binding protein [Ferrovibrio sp.]|uniref:ABC transporter ATP-binding protein n=1 Tax=Ferrovibrio sp. TaxID=1917215 RepID=UPI002611C504|nr:ABC transporter ATP-binding protein [Ferrovibrio sp.]
MSQPKLDIIGITKRYGHATALEPTSLAVEAGEFMTLLGPSGSGKTTLLMMIAGLTEPSGGVIRLDGSDITALPAYRRNIGVVFQNYALFPHLTVAENVAFPLRMRRQSDDAIRSAVARALDLVRLPHLAARLPRELSGGQQQRVAFARAIVFEPEIVLMDEPLGALDKRLRDELKLEIRRLHRDLGTTIVYVTHDQEEAMLLSDRICLMNNARIEQLDLPTALYERPKTRFAAEFVGESNILTGRVEPAGIVAGGLHLPTAHLSLLPGPGAEASVLIRPERIALGATGERGLAMTGIVTEVIGLGGTRRLVVRVNDAIELTVLTFSGDKPVAAGETVSLTVAAEDIVPLASGKP